MSILYSVYNSRLPQWIIKRDYTHNGLGNSTFRNQRKVNIDHEKTISHMKNKISSAITNTYN